MRERPRGEVIGIPTHSVYEGLGDEVDEQVVEEAINLGGSSMEVDDV
jgi:transketolase C-terminal domain/subunit